MRRWLVFLFAWLLPLQFAWAGASAYCQHETGEQQAAHIGHHFHAHEDEPRKSTASQPMADADCASCHAGAATAIANVIDGCDVEATSLSVRVAVSPPFSSALARAPDRPQWRRLV